MNSYDYAILGLVDQWEQSQQPAKFDDQRKDVCTVNDLMRATRKNSRYDVRFKFALHRDTAVTQEAEERRWKKAMSDLDNILDERRRAYLAATHKTEPDIKVPEAPDYQTVKTVPLPKQRLTDCSKTDLAEFYVNCCVAANHIFTPAEIDQCDSMPRWNFFWRRGMDFMALIYEAVEIDDRQFMLILENTDARYLRPLWQNDQEAYQEFRQQQHSKRAATREKKYVHRTVA